MTDRAPGDDTRAQDREDVSLDSYSVGQPASAHGNPGAVAVPESRSRRCRRRRARHGPQRVRRSSGRRPDRAAGRRRAEGAEPVGLRAHPLLPPQNGGDQPRRAVLDLPRRDLRQARGALRLRRARPPQHHLATDDEGQASLRHRPARPRLPQPRHLRPADVALGRVLRRLPLDRDRDDDRLAGRLLRRRGRQPADALHRPDPDPAGPRRAPDRGRVLRQRRSAQGRSDPRAPASGRVSPASSAASSSPSARRSTSRPRRRAVPATAASSCGTCSRTRSDRSSSTRR